MIHKDSTACVLIFLCLFAFSMWQSTRQRRDVLIKGDAIARMKIVMTQTIGSGHRDTGVSGVLRFCFAS
jgi:hypothetical protein